MGKKIDLTGQRFGRLTVIEKNGKIGSHTAWICVCDCGNKVRVKTDNLRSGHTKSCGCLKKANVKIGDRFGKLTVVGEGEKNYRGRKTFKCICDCGKTINVLPYELAGGHTKSCGCLSKELKKGNKYNLKHGETKTRLYNIWKAMKQRTSNPKDIGYKYYGGKGVKVCYEWKNSFEAFRDWALKNGYNENLTLDRIDCSKDYMPENCRWVDWETQENNRSNNRLITYNGKTQTVSQWAREIGLEPRTLFRRINDKGWSVEKALTTPLLKRYKKQGGKTE